MPAAFFASVISRTCGPKMHRPLVGALRAGPRSGVQLGLGCPPARARVRGREAGRARVEVAGDELSSISARIISEMACRESRDSIDYDTQCCEYECNES